MEDLRSSEVEGGAVSIIVLIITIGFFICFREAPGGEEVSSILDLDARIRFLLKQFQEKGLTLKEEYTMPEGISGVTPESLESLLKSILNHMKLRENIFLVYHAKEEKVFKNRAGSYEQASLGYRAVNLVLDPRYLLEDYVSIIAHECAHHFMREHNFREMEGLENEKNTDALTVLLGFGRFLKATHTKRFYFRGSNITTEGPTDYYDTLKLGYLSQEEIEYITRRHLNILQKGREQKRLIRAAREREELKVQMLEYQVEQLKLIWERNRRSVEKILDAKATEKRLQRWEVERLSQLIYKYRTVTSQYIVNELIHRIQNSSLDDYLIERIAYLHKTLKEDSIFLEGYLKEEDL